MATGLPVSQKTVPPSAGSSPLARCMVLIRTFAPRVRDENIRVTSAVKLETVLPMSGTRPMRFTVLSTA